MQLKLLVLLLFSVSLECVLSQTPTISSTDWEFQQIIDSLVDRENRVKSLNAKIQPSINATIADLKSNVAFKLTVAALQSVQTLLANLLTVSSYGTNETASTCDDVALRIQRIVYDIQKCLKIKFEVDTNATLLLIQWSNLNGAYVANYFFMTDAQKISVQSILTSLFLLVDEYNQNSLTHLVAIYKYSQLYIELIFCKKTYCTCPTQLSANSTSALTTTDNNVKQIQTTLDTSENNIKNISADIISKVAVINPDLKKNSLFLLITTTLDAIVILSNGYLKLTTAIGTVNSSLTCDDAAMKVAFIEYKTVLYFQTSIEAAKNASFVLFQLNNLNAYCSANTLQLSSAQKQAIESIVTSLNNLVEEYKQYLIKLGLAYLKSLQLLLNAKQARMLSCNCSDITNSTTISTILPTTTARKYKNRKNL